MTKEVFIEVDEKDYAVLKAAADLCGLTIEEAPTQFAKEQMTKRFRKRLNRGPARIYAMPVRGAK